MEEKLLAEAHPNFYRSSLHKRTPFKTATVCYQTNHHKLMHKNNVTGHSINLRLSLDDINLERNDNVISYFFMFDTVEIERNMNIILDDVFN